MVNQTSAVRHKIMAAVPTKNSTPELLLRKELHRRGFRYRLHDRKLPGKPDLVFPRKKLAVFVHGCFWHRHRDCPLTTTPKTNQGFWTSKFDANVKRDARNRHDLEELGWQSVTLWECEIKRSPGDAADVVQLGLTN